MVIVLEYDPKNLQIPYCSQFGSKKIIIITIIIIIIISVGHTQCLTPHNFILGRKRGTHNIYELNNFQQCEFCVSN